MRKLDSPWRARTRALHRWLSVVAGGYFLLMALSGVLLNHRQLLAGIDLPRAWLPGDYEYRNWNRNALRGVVRGGGGTRYLFGEAGVWRVPPAGVPVPLLQGYPAGAYLRDTRALLSVDGELPYLLAATRQGVFGRPLGDEDSVPWVAVPLPSEAPTEELVDLVRAGSRLIAVTRSRLYGAEAANWPPRFLDVTPRRAAEPRVRLPLFRLLFHAHSGDLWGAGGRLAVDASGVLLVLFGGTGLWFAWRRARGTVARGRGAALCRRGLRWHLRWGRWCWVPLLLVALTGLFQRPPFLVAVAGVTYPPHLHPAPRGGSPWQELLRKAAYDPEREELILATDDGFYRGPADGSHPFRLLSSGPPVSVMGATVLHRQRDGLYWVGSMSGLYAWDPATGWVTDAFTGNPPLPTSGRPVGERAVSGLLFSSRGKPLVVDYFQGVIDGSGTPTREPMPPELASGGRISLWHLLFEIHNGRVFGFLLGWWSWVVVPVGGLSLTATLLSGAWARGRNPRR